MDQATPVDGAQRPGELDGQLQDAIGRQGATRQQLVEALARQQLAHDERLPVVLAPVVHGADVRMRDERGDVGLPPETVDRLLRRVRAATQHLERHGALQPGITCTPGLDRPVLADELEQLVVRDRGRSVHAR